MVSVLEAIVEGDQAQRFLIPHLRQTESLLRRALRTLDPRADCRVSPAADLGVPYDALRLAGGFATGCLVEWDCRVPVVPVDITMNIDTSSVFWLDGDPAEVFTEEAVVALRRRIIEDSSYEWNLDRGNHFIVTCRRADDGQHALVLHSNEKEFKDQFNGLCPTPGNWFADAVRVFEGERPVRLLTGDKAELFSDMAQMLLHFNVVRHRFLANLLLNGRVGVTSDIHKHHYYMPATVSAVIGCYLCEPGEEVPVFSTVGQPIALFEAASGGRNAVSLLTGENRLIVPHGWGMTSSRPLDVTRSGDVLTFNGRTYELAPGVSLLGHPDIGPRLFANSAEFFAAVENHTPGRLTTELVQTASYSRHGFLRHG